MDMAGCGTYIYVYIYNYIMISNDMVMDGYLYHLQYVYNG